MHLLNEQYIWVLMLCYLKDPFSDRSQYIWKEEFCLTRKLYEPNRIEPLVMMVLLDDQSNHHLHADSTIGIDGDTKNHSNGVHGDHGDHSNFNHTCSPPNLEYSSGLGGFNLVKFKNSTLTDISHHIAKAKRLWIHEGDYRKGAKICRHKELCR